MTQHQIEMTEQGVKCLLCQRFWSTSPIGECPGVRLYSYESVPWETMTTVTQLREKKLRPRDKNKPDACYYRFKDRTYIYLYRIDEALPPKEPTEKQRAALEKGKQARKAKYTCERCSWYDKAHGQNRYHRVMDYEVDGGVKRYCNECIDHLEWIEARRAIEQRMKVLLEGDKPIAILDTETTGLPDSYYFQVVEISIIDKHGAVLFNSLIKPTVPVPPGATLIHGITDEMLVNAPTFAVVWPGLEKILSTHEIWCYNTSFDRDAILSSAYYHRIEVPKGIQRSDRWQCCMLEYAHYYGDWSDYHKNYRYQSLQSACQDLGVESNGYHRALGDVLNTLGVMRALASRADGKQVVPAYMPHKGEEAACG